MFGIKFKQNKNKNKRKLEESKKKSSNKKKKTNNQANKGSNQSKPKPKSKPNNPSNHEQNMQHRQKIKKPNANANANVNATKTLSGYKASGKASTLSKLQQQFKAKMDSGQFRWLNEQLYTTNSDSAFDLFQKNSSLFQVYHQGFANQVQTWPSNPVDVIISYIKRMHGYKKLVICDLGCGEAQIAKTLQKNTVHSYDLVSNNKHVVACNIAKLPLKLEAVDVAVFCLSLMGTDFCNFLKEAYRVLKSNGKLIIAEVKSRFVASDEMLSTSSDNISDKNEEMNLGIDNFIQVLTKLGFDLESNDASNDMFVLLIFHKSPNRKANFNVSSNLKSCKYKKR